MKKVCNFVAYLCTYYVKYINQFSILFYRKHKNFPGINYISLLACDFAAMEVNIENYDKVKTFSNFGRTYSLQLEFKVDNTRGHG